MPSTSSQYNIFIIAIITMILILLGFIALIFYFYRKRQIAYFSEMEQIKLRHEKDILKTQLEIQEQTFQDVSREIHDNIGQKLSLAKLHLNTLVLGDPQTIEAKIAASIEIIGRSIADLSDISRSMNSELILRDGLICTLETEVAQLNKSGAYNISLAIEGETEFFDPRKELILFRIVQEALNNVIKHSEAKNIELSLVYDANAININILDDGVGFNIEKARKSNGLINMRKRAELLMGSFEILSNEKLGTKVMIKIPFRV